MSDFFRYRTKLHLLIFISALAIQSRAGAQSGINTDTALAPSTGTLIWRQQFRYIKQDGDPSPLNRDIETWLISTTLVYGLDQDVTTIFNIPYRFREVNVGSTGMSFDQNGLSDLTALVKWRIHEEDFGPVDSERFSLLGGLEIRSGDSRFTSDSYDPILGAVYTRYEDRHGFNTDLLLKNNTGGDADRIRYDGAYTFRLFPVAYDAQSKHSIFAAAELNGLYDTNGDHELFFSPGISYATFRWAFEATVQIPVWQDIDRRLDNDIIIGIGWKVIF